MSTSLKRRFVDNGPKVEILSMPDSGLIKPAAGHVASDLSELWNLTAAVPRQVSGPSLQELDDAADAMAAVVAAQLGRVAGFAARNLGGVTIASGLWNFEAPNQPRDSEGRWTEGGGGDIGEPVEPTVSASVQVGDYTVRAVDDPDGLLSTNLEPGKFVEVTEDAREDPGGGMLIDLAKADGIAGGIETTAQSARNARTPTGPDVFDNGPASLIRRQVEKYDIAAYHDGNGDLFGEGERFVTLSAPRSRREPVDDWDNADIRMGLGDADAFARALREMADMFTTASGLIVGPGMDSGLWTFQTGSPGPGTPRQAAVSPDDLAVIRDRWTVITDDVLGPKIAADYLAGAKGQHNRLAAALPPKVRRLAARPLADQAALLYAAGAANRLKGIGDELWQAARAALLEGMAKGESVAKLARRIRDVTGVSMGRAMAIARTESMGARSAGSYEEMLNSGVVVSKTWQATEDLRTRPTHVVADGQTVPMAGKFTVGGWPADRPHDPMLPAEEAVNCRCTLTYGVDTDVATAASAVEPAPPDLWIFHLPGGHNQETHGGGSVGPGGGVDLLAAGHGEALAQGALADAEANSYDFDREQFEPLAGRNLYRGGGVGPHGDEALHSIAEKQGFGGPARKVSRKEMDRGIKAGDTAMYRGVRGNKNMTATQIHERTATGKPYYGLGFSGNGIYASSNPLEAAGYGQVARYALHRNAKVVDYRDLQREHARFLDSVGRGSVQHRVFKDPGRYAAARGYDAIRWRRGEEAGKPPGMEDEFIVLNRTATIAELS